MHKTAANLLLCYVGEHDDAYRWAERAVFAGVPDRQLLHYRVPAVWLDDVRQVADEDGLLALADHLPAEALLELAPPTRRSGRPAEPRTGIRFPVPMRSAASASCPTRRSCAGRSTIRGRSGRSFCTPLNGRWWNGASAARRACQDLPEPARPSWRCIARCISPASTRTPACS